MAGGLVRGGVRGMDSSTAPSGAQSQLRHLIRKVTLFAVDVGCAAMSHGVDGRTFRVKIMLKRYNDKKQPTKAYAYKVNEIEVLPGTLANPGASAEIGPRGRTSITGANLLHGVFDVNGNPLVDDAPAAAGAVSAEINPIMEGNREPARLARAAGSEPARRPATVSADRGASPTGSRRTHGRERSGTDRTG